VPGVGQTAGGSKPGTGVSPSPVVVAQSAYTPTWNSDAEFIAFVERFQRKIKLTTRGNPTAVELTNVSHDDATIPEGFQKSIHYIMNRVAPSDTEMYKTLNVVLVDHQDSSTGKWLPRRVTLEGENGSNDPKKFGIPRYTDNKNKISFGFRNLAMNAGFLALGLYAVITNADTVTITTAKSSIENPLGDDDKTWTDSHLFGAATKPYIDAIKAASGAAAAATPTSSATTAPSSSNTPAAAAPKSPAASPAVTGGTGGGAAASSSSSGVAATSQTAQADPSTPVVFPNATEGIKILITQIERIIGLFTTNKSTYQATNGRWVSLPITQFTEYEDVLRLIAQQYITLPAQKRKQIHESRAGYDDMMFENTTEGFLMRIGFLFPAIENYKAIEPIAARYEGFPAKIADIMRTNPIKIKISLTFLNLSLSKFKMKEVEI
jgi:hypothetical protein